MTKRNLTRRSMIAAGTALAGAGAAAAENWTDVEELVFFTLGDWGRRGIPAQQSVADAMEEWREKEKPQFIMTVGDNFYPLGQGWPFWSHWEASFTNVYSPELRALPWVPALGNHDYLGSLDAQMRHESAHGWKSRGHRYYVHRPTVRVGGRIIDLVVIDTSPLEEPYFGSVGGRKVQKAWIEKALRDQTAGWKLVFGHHAVFSGGQHGRSPRMANWLQKRLEDHGVQAYVCGHEHDLQHIVAGQRKAPHYILTGAGSECERDVIDVPGTWWQKSHTPGFTVFRVTRDMITVDFVDASTRARIHQAKIPFDVADAPPAGTSPEKDKPAYQPLVGGKRPVGYEDKYPGDRRAA